MKFVKILVPVLTLGILAFIWMAPIGPVPGFFIGGTQAESPASWPDTSGVHEIKLKVNGVLPRVVIIWVIDYEGELYIVGGNDSGWVKTIGSSAPVEMRLGDNTYSLTATLMPDGWEPMMQAYINKYQPDYPDIVAGFPTPEAAAGSIAVFSLSR